MIRGDDVRIAGVCQLLGPDAAQPFGRTLALQPLLQGQLFARLDLHLQRWQDDLEVDGQPVRKQVAADINFVINDAGVLRLERHVATRQAGHRLRHIQPEGALFAQHITAGAARAGLNRDGQRQQAGQLAQWQQNLRAVLVGGQPVRQG